MATSIPAEFTQAEADAELDAAFGDVDAPLADPRPAGLLDAAAAEQAAEYAQADAERTAKRLAHLEEMQVLNEQTMADQAQLIAEQKDALRIVREHRDKLIVTAKEVAPLEVALKRERKSVDVLLTQRDAAERQAETYAADAERLEAGMAKLSDALAERTIERDQARAALGRAQERAQTATDAAESYRCELMEAKRVLRNIAELSDGALHH